MRNSWFILDVRQRGPKLLNTVRTGSIEAQGRKAGTGEVAQVDNELPAKRTSRGGRGLRRKVANRHHRDRYADENSKRRVEKRGRINRS